MGTEDRLTRIVWTLRLRRVLPADMPESAFAMQGVVAEHPIADEQRPVGGRRQSDWTKIFAALHEGQAVRHERRTVRPDRVTLDAIIRPRRHQELPAIFLGQ